ncbi:unnamed protein product [Rotaria sp. Silwood1]|nr:unnamed protein product [Rotaria sp. Silwood1]CAF1543357.1 unnamed protein product [Rotaria sp. Silwood1]
MKKKENDSKTSDKSLKQIKKNGKIEKKKKKDNFEVHIPRIIVRNLSFKVNEDQLKKAFEKSNAAISNVSIVKKDGQSKGFGFITFDKLEDAQKAIQTMNGQKVLGRPIALDWSLPKNVYEKMQEKTSIQNDSYGIQSNINASDIKQEQTEIKQEVEDEQEESIEDEEEISKTRTNESSRDIREHRTLFVRNVPFDATEDDLKNIFSSNGQYSIQSCRLVIDPISKHPRGSAFIQFTSSNDAEKCLNLFYTYHGQELQVDMALGRNQLVKAKELRDKKKENIKKHDQRNLSLANYGVILNLNELDGNENDLKKRQNLEDIKKQKLKNSLYFISSTRLTIHNLPKNIDDDKLRKIIIDILKKNNISMKDIIINECRVMKTNKDAKKSLGYGFINVSRHEIALKIIELLNNNKYIFGSNRRPIVQFSIENRHALQLKEERRERLHAKQELLKNSIDKTLSFENNIKKKKKQRDLLEQQQQNKKIRLSEIIKQEINEDLNNSLNDNENSMEIHNELKFINNSNIKKKKKRSKTKSKSEIRDNLDRIIAANTKNKLQLPQKTKKKWFE